MTEKQPPPDKNLLRKHMRTMLIIAVIVFGGLFLFNEARKFLLNRFFAHFSLGAVTISTSIAKEESWTPSINAIGSLVAINGVQVSPEVAGMVTDIFFQSGQIVKAGQKLVQLDDRTDQQDLINLNSQLTLTKINYDRQVQLFQTKSTSQSSLDSANAEFQQALAAVNKTKILISEKLITAPFTGKIGIRNVNIGQYVSPGTPLVNLQSLNPLHVQFSLPEQNFKLLSYGQPLEIQVSNYPNEKFKAKITAIDASVDPVTRNILIEGTVPNDNFKLYPGMFANVQVLLPKQNKVVTVPQTAVSVSLYGDIVYVVEQSGKDKEGKPIYTVHQQYVTIGDRRGNEIAILQGIKAGQQVVNSGQLKLENGAQVIINNSVKLPRLSPEELQENR